MQDYSNCQQIIKSITMQIKRKQMILNLNLGDESSEDEKPHITSFEEIPISAISGYKRTAQGKFNINAIKPGIFQQQNDDYYNTAIVTYPEPNVSRLQPKQVYKRPKQISQEAEEEQIIKPQGNSIHLLTEVIHEDQNISSSSSKEVIKQQSHITEQDNQQNTNNHVSITSTKPKTLLNIDLDESQSQSEKRSQGEPESHEHQQTLKMLAFKPHERERVSFQQIALTHDPFQNMRIFTEKQIGIQKILHLSIDRNRSGLNFLWPEYQLYYECGAPMLYCKKMMANTTSNLYITVKKDITEVNDPFFVAKLRANYSGSIYQVFSKGINPKHAELSKTVRSIQATIKFRPQVGCQQPREFQVYTLAANVKYYELQGVKPGEELGLDQLFKLQKNKSKIFHFQNRKPIYSAAIEGYILNFGGRVNKASVKNFILQDTIAHREVLMFGKADEDKYRVDVSWPLKPYVAYCVCIANIDSKFLSQ